MSVPNCLLPNRRLPIALLFIAYSQMSKRPLTPEQRRARRRRRKETEIIFVNGKQKRVKRAPTIEGLPVEEFIRRNADPTWLMANGYYEYLP